MCYESMYFSKEKQAQMLKERKKALEERLETVKEMMESLEKQEVPA